MWKIIHVHKALIQRGVGATREVPVDGLGRVGNEVDKQV